MTDHLSLHETCCKLIRQDKKTIYAQLGQPAASLNSFALYEYAEEMLVLFFDNAITQNLCGAASFDKTSQLLWHEAIRLLPDDNALISQRLRSVQRMLERYGMPHAVFGSFITTLQYVTSKGNLLTAELKGEEIVRVTQKPLTELIKRDA